MMSKASVKAAILQSIAELGPQTRLELHRSTQINETSCKRVIKEMHTNGDLFVDHWVERGHNTGPCMARFAIRDAKQADKTHPRDMPVKRQKAKPNNSTMIGKRNRARIYALVNGERTCIDIQELFGLSDRHAEKHIKTLRDQKKIHICGWRNNHRGRYSAIYARGDRPDLEYPPRVYGRAPADKVLQTYKRPTKSYAGNPFGFLIEQMT